MRSLHSHTYLQHVCVSQRPSFSLHLIGISHGQQSEACSSWERLLQASQGLIALIVAPQPRTTLKLHKWGKKSSILTFYPTTSCPLTCSPRCLRLDLQPLAYLWRRDQESLLSEMISSDLHAILIKVAAFGESLPLCVLPSSAPFFFPVRKKAQYRMIVFPIAQNKTRWRVCAEG